MKRFLKWALTLIAILVAGLLLILAIESIRGARTWATTRAYLESEGEPLTFAEVIPPLPPDEDNFCATPLIASMTDYEKDENGEIVYRNPKMHDRLAAMRMPIDDAMAWPEVGSSISGELPDFEAWAKAFARSGRFTYPDRSLPAAEQIVEALEVFDAEFAELATAAERPVAVFRIDWDANVIARVGQAFIHGDDVGDLAQLLTLRAEAALAAGRPEMARESLPILYRLAEARSREPTQLSQTLASFQQQAYLDVIWFGLKTGTWRDEDLEWLGGRLGTDDLFEWALLSFRAEMVGFHIESFDWLKKSGSASGGEWIDLVGGAVPAAVVPDGVWDRFKSDGCRILYEGAILPIKQRRDFSHLQDGAFDYEGWHPIADLMRTSLSTTESQLGTVLQKVVRFECARVACALERAFRESGQYPESLANLVPGRIGEIPRDPMDGKPLRYLRTEDGRYRLYSIGPDWIDGGGEVRFDPETDFPFVESGDWVWAYAYPERPESEPESGARKIVLP